MDNIDELIILYDYYGELFNELQRECFEEYYFNNLSLAEIAVNMNKSRNAIHKVIKKVCDKLYSYENILKLYEKDNKLREIINKVTDDKIKNELEKLI